MSNIISRRQMAAELFAASLLEICPSILVLETAVSRVGFICDVVSPFPLTQDYIDMAEGRVKEKIKTAPAFHVMEMTTRNAKDLLIHHKQRIRADYLDMENPLVYVVTMGDYVNAVFEDPSTELDEIGVVSIEEVSKVGELVYQKKARDITRLSGVVFDSKNELKEYRKKVKEAQKFDHFVNGTNWELFEILEKGVLWREEGLNLRDKIEEKMAKDLKENGYEKLSIEGDIETLPKKYKKFFISKIENERGPHEFGLKDAPSTKVIVASSTSLLQMMGKWDTIFGLTLRFERFSKGPILGLLEGEDRLGLKWEIGVVEEDFVNGKTVSQMRIYIDRIFALVLEQFLEKELLKKSFL